MKRLIAILLTALIVLPCLAATTITYSYDKQHRLTEVSYSASEKTFYSYDAANNLDLEVSITDSKYLKSFLLYLSRHSSDVGGWFAQLKDAVRDITQRLAPWRTPKAQQLTNTTT